MFKKHKVLNLLFLFLVSCNSLANGQIKPNLSRVKNLLLGAGGALAAGYTAAKVFKHWVYFEPQASFDANTANLLAKVNDKYGWQFAKLDDYNYQSNSIKAQIDHDLAADIAYQYDIPLYLIEFKQLQAELDARLARLTSWSGTEYLCQKWSDDLGEASVNMYNLQLWLEHVQIMPQ